VVFFTGRFAETNRQWLATVDGGDWEGAWARWIVSAFAPDSPYASSPWRREKGALWDVRSHALSMLTAALGPVESRDGGRRKGDLVHLIFPPCRGSHEHRLVDDQRAVSSDQRGALPLGTERTVHHATGIRHRRTRMGGCAEELLDTSQPASARTL